MHILVAVVFPFIIVIKGGVVIRIVGEIGGQTLKFKKGLNVKVLRAVLIYFSKAFANPFSE